MTSSTPTPRVDAIEPCPFCGGKARMLQPAFSMFTAYCSACDVRLGPRRTWGEAATAWNTRAASVREGELEREIARLREAVKDANDSEEAAQLRCSYEACACMFDHKDDVCAVHSPAVAAATEKLTALAAENARLVALVESAFNEGFADCIYRMEHGGVEEYTADEAWSVSAAKAASEVKQ